MPRLTDKSLTARAPQTAAAVPELPDFDPQLAAQPGGQRTNAALQRWWDLVSQRIEFTNASNDGRMFDFTRVIDGIRGEITVEAEITSSMKDYLESRYTINVAAGAVATGITIFSATGPNINVSYIAFQADRFLINTASGGNKQIFSVSATEAKFGDVLTVDLANAKLFIGTGTYNNNNTAFYVDDDGFFSLKSKLSFNPNTNTLTVDGSGTFSGTITATAGAIGGWTINATTLSQNNATLNSAGQLILGTSNDIIYLSATDTTYRMWVGNVTAASAAFSVTKAGALFSTSGTIGGWTISSTTLTSSNVVISSTGSIALGTTNDILIVSAADSTYRLWAGNATAASATFSVTKAGALYSTSGTIAGFNISATSLSVGTGLDQITIFSTGTGLVIGDNSGATQRLRLFSVSGSSNVGIDLRNGSNNTVLFGNCIGTGAGLFQVNNSSGTTVIALVGATGNVNATSYTGDTLVLNSDLTVGGLVKARSSAASLAYTFSSDTTSGILWQTTGDFRMVASGTSALVIQASKVIFLVDLKLNTSRVAGSPTPGGTINILDASGGTVSLITT